MNIQSLVTEIQEKHGLHKSSIAKMLGITRGRLHQICNGTDISKPRLIKSYESDLEHILKSV